ncbi:MAG: ABC transporter permease subunit [Micromonosporaceae bacterium]|nr:ABC transporter permease subunit [Micromonosporaceae bacterium]
MRKIRFPHALPQIFVGLKTAVALAVIGAVIGEFVGADAGLGYIVVQSQASANTALAFAAIILLRAMSIVMFYLVVAAERWLVPWAQEQP